MELTIEQAIQQGVAAHKEGKLEEAEKLYRAILGAQPQHADAHHNLGVLAVSVGKVEGAIPHFKAALNANVQVEQFWLSYIDALISLGRVDDAREALQGSKASGLKSEKIDQLGIQLSTSAPASVSMAKPAKAQIDGLIALYTQGKLDEALAQGNALAGQFPNDATIPNIVGAVYSALGRLEEAIVSLNKAIELKTDYADAYNNLGAAFKDLGRFEDAADNYNKAIEYDPTFAAAYTNLGVVLNNLGKYEESIQSYSKAVELRPDFSIGHNNLAIALSKANRYGEAASSFETAIQINLSKPLNHAITVDIEKSKYYLLRCFFHLGEEAKFFELLDDFIFRGIANPIIGSLVCRAALKFNVPGTNLFCSDPLKYVSKIDLNTQCDFGDVFVKTAKTVLDEGKVPERRQGLLTNGQQTYGNLFDLEPELTKEIQKVIRRELEKYRLSFQDSEEGLIRSWPAEYSLYGWLISMKSGGELQPHMHENGWLSGSIYINVPERVLPESGNLVVCIEDDRLDLDGNQKESIDVVTGSLCLFPASLLHYTVPFESEEERIVLAFDMVPK